jgi:AcrR family transcriptional regulator
MGLHERRQREKESIRANILQAAFTLAKTEGWGSLSIRKIADAIEYSAPVVYDYFENKEAILFEISGWLSQTTHRIIKSSAKA